MFPDYQSLMGAEISTYAKRVLEKECFARWEEALIIAPRLRVIFDAILVSQKVSTNENNRRNQELEARRQAFREAVFDPRTLGEIELFVSKKIWYGMPAWRNFDSQRDE